MLIITKLYHSQETASDQHKQSLNRHALVSSVPSASPKNAFQSKDQLTSGHNSYSDSALSSSKIVQNYINIFSMTFIDARNYTQSSPIEFEKLQEKKKQLIRWKLNQYFFNLVTIFFLLRQHVWDPNLSALRFFIKNQIFFYFYAFNVQKNSVFLNYINQFLMIRAGNNRQRLVLNRPSKSSLQPCLQQPELHIINFVKMSPFNPRLSYNGQAITNPSNSSNVQKNNSKNIKQKSHILQNSEKISQQIYRRKSLSAKDSNINDKNGNQERRASKTLGKLPTIISQSSETIIHNICSKMINGLKENGTFTFKSSRYSIKKEALYQTVAEIVKQTAKQIDRSSKQSQKFILPKYLHNKLKICKQYSILETKGRQKNLSISSEIISLHKEYSAKANDRQLFWQMLQNFQQKKSTQQNFNFLVNRTRYLKQQIRSKQMKSCQLSQEIKGLNNEITSKRNNIDHLQQRIKQSQYYLASVQQKIKGINQFVNHQPNKILRAEAEGYKEREQQLFDQALKLQQSTPLYIDSYIGDCILVPNESFKLTLKSFPYQKPDQNNVYKLSEKDLNTFKNSLSKAYQLIVEKLSSIIQKKYKKIKNFVEIMRRLASYTIGKREYLTQINKKMAIVSTNIDRHTKELQNFFIKAQFNNAESMKIVVQTKNLLNCLRTLYCQAQVFY